MLKFFLNRKNQITFLFIVIGVALIYRLSFLTIENGDYYYDKSVNNRIKKIETYAGRGDIYDRNGVLIATSDIGFVLKLNSGAIPSNELNTIAINLYDFLEEQDEVHIEFPIQIVDGQYVYSYDENIKKWLSSNGYPADETAEEVFQEVRAFNYIDEALSNYEAYRILYNGGMYLPISTSKMKFLDEIYKDTFLDMYGLDADTSAEEAFKAIRNRKEFGIDEDCSDEDAYKILVLKHAIKEKGYLKYELITVAPSVKKETAVLLQERAYEFTGISVSYESIRRYPFGDSAAHILGYMGKISTDSEYEKFVTQNDYDQNQMIGKVGIEGNYELDLHGENGYKYIEVDVYGKYVKDIDEEDYGLDSKKATSGEDIYLTIDMNLQHVLEKGIEKALNQIQIGGVYDSPWGDYKYADSFPQAETAAGVVVDVNTGEVLAMASYPSYDINLFSTGISQEDWNALNPVNKRNPLAARPLYNMATMMAVQPGSIYKMMTGFAAMLQGLDPYQKIYSNGYIEIGNQRYGCWYWNQYHLKHGPTDFFKAIETSCNYYFYNISTGKDHYRDLPLNYDITPSIIIEASKKFGLNDKTGVEIGEVNFGVPDPEKKKRTIEILLSRELTTLLKSYFPESITRDEDQLSAVIETIVSWSDENPSRGDIIKRLIDLGANDDYYVTEQLADVIKYDYFNLMKWYEGDTLNLSIGQGDHTYTPVQVARYIAAIANDGYLKELSLVKKVGDTAIVKEQTTESADVNNYLDIIREAMNRVTHGSEGTARTVFQDFPVDVAGKTGTAEKEGLIPPLDEVAYLTEYLKEFAPKLNQEEVETKTIEIIKRRSEELSTLEKEKNEATDDTIKALKEDKLNKLIEQDYLNKGVAMRAAIKELSNDTITDDEINAYRLPYDSYSWFVSFAPYDNPEIAVIVFIPQGGHGGYAAPVARDVYAEYFHLSPPADE
ncbi:MAG: penicillin-binding protein 2 [Clostridiales bacterium]|jgi:penicillin-binding protein 2|nr:penicillin-binding protein 2 [Clostridiales bacterium]MDN5298431.1 penicillin-binding protein 2 [Clostridiales bacterium]